MLFYREPFFSVAELCLEASGMSQHVSQFEICVIFPTGRYEEKREFSFYFLRTAKSQKNHRSKDTFLGVSAGLAMI